jgi:hypothetical protein
MERVVWSYWEGATSKLLEKCEASWHLHLGCGWRIRILNARTIAQYGVQLPPAFHGVLPALRSDYVRLALLELHGGVWMDASVFQTESLDAIIAYLSTHDVVAFERHKNAAYIENWFLAVRASHVPLITLWKTTFVDIIEQGPPYGSHPVYETPCQKSDEYFVAYQAYCVTIRRHPELASRVHVYAIGPLWHAFAPMSSFRPLVKLTHGARIMHRCASFPLIYLFLVALCTVLLVGVAACMAVPVVESDEAVVHLS